LSILNKKPAKKEETSVAWTFDIFDRLFNRISRKNVKWILYPYNQTLTVYIRIADVIYIIVKYDI